MDVRKSVKRWYELVEEGYDVFWFLLKFYIDGVSISGYVGIDFLKYVDVGNQCIGDLGVLEFVLDVVVVIGQDFLGG